jgi:enoyl-CoA hydratase/carnithine racemase
MEDEPEVRVTVLTGKGDNAISAGADLGNPKTHKVTSAGEHLATVSPMR